MRVISGKYKGKRFSPPKKFPSRPTTDMAKEALFNILDARVYFENLEILDLFSGTGNISLEFLSRGVGKVESVDSNFISCKFQKKLREEVGIDNWQIIQEDAFDYLKSRPFKWDIIFADPPYGSVSLEQLIDDIFINNRLVNDGMLIIEHGQESDLSEIPKFKEMRDYGGVYFSFFEP